VTQWIRMILTDHPEGAAKEAIPICLELRWIHTDAGRLYPKIGDVDEDALAPQ
jgi:hypothetical protein